MISTNYFTPTTNQIKNTIESLINREYIQRMEEKNWYKYIS